MKSEDLKRIQEPIKKSYRTNPGAALITLRASSKAGEGITCKIETGKNMIEAGLHPASGGDGSSICSGDMLLESLAACAGVTLKAVATAIDFDLHEGTVQVAGELWSARSDTPIAAGNPIRVVKREGFILVVEKSD